MSDDKIRSREDLRAKARRLGMVSDVAWDERQPAGRDSMQHRVGANAMRELGLSEEQIVKKYGYNPQGLASFHPMESPRYRVVARQVVLDYWRRRVERGEVGAEEALEIIERVAQDVPPEPGDEFE